MENAGERCRTKIDLTIDATEVKRLRCWQRGLGQHPGESRFNFNGKAKEVEGGD